MAAIKSIVVKEKSLLCASSFYFNSHKNVIEELVYNSLDAKSSSIAIRICLKQNIIQVLDNGFGIAKDDFRLLGQKYVSSKIENNGSLEKMFNTYGSRGLSLACIIEMSKNVKISSKCDGHLETWMKIFCDGVCKDFYLTSSRPSKGTTIEIIGFLYKFNIKQKSIDITNELNNIKTFLKQLSLVHCNVSISLRDDSSDEIIYKIHKNRDIYETLRFLFDISRNELQDLQVEKNQYKVKAYIGKCNFKLKAHHWIYLNGRIILNSKLHKITNELLSKQLLNRTINKKVKMNNFIDEIEVFNKKIPFYFIFITCPSIDYDINYNNNRTHIEFKNWGEINKLIEKLMNFYCVDVKKPSRNEENKDKNKENFNTREKVKEIMEKILNNNGKKNKILQMQNGIKGKQMKRKIKTKHDNTQQSLLFNKPMMKPSEDENFDDQIVYENKIITNKTSGNQGTKNINIAKSYNKKTGKKSCITAKKKQLRPVIDKKLVQKFENPTNSIRRRCEWISNKAQKIVNTDFFTNNIKRTGVMHNMNVENTTVTEIYNKSHKITSLCSSNIASEKQNNFFNSYIKETNSVKVCSSRNTKELTHQVFPELQGSIIGQNMRNYNFSSKSNCTYTTFNSHKKNYINKRCSPILDKRINNEKHQKINVNTSKNLLKAAIINKHYKRFYDSLTPINCNHSNNSAKEKQNKKISKHVNNLSTFVSRSNQYFNSGNTYVVDILNSVTNSNNLITSCSTQMTAKHTYTLETEGALPNVFAEKEYFTDAEMLKSLSEHMKNNIDIENVITSKLFSISQNIMENSNFKSLFKDSRENIHLEHSMKYKLPSISKLGNPTDIGNIIPLSEGLEHKGHDLTANFPLSCEFQNLSKKENIQSKSLSQDSDKTIDPLRYCQTILNSNELRDVETEFDLSFFNALNANDKNIENISQYFRDDKESNTDILYKSTENQINIYTQNIQSTYKLLKANNDWNNFKINSRRNYVPKGMSQIFKIKHNKKLSYYNIAEEYYKDVVYKQFAEDIFDKINIYEDSAKNINDNDTKEITKVKQKIEKDTSDLIFDSDSLKFSKILGQVDLKFIAARISARNCEIENSVEYLVLFDQHAVDERISLERNLSDYFDGTKWKSAKLDTVKLKLSEENYFDLYNYKEKFIQFGFEWSFGDREIAISAVPKALLGKHLRKAEIVLEAINVFITEQIDVIKSLKGNVSLYPKSIMEMVCSEACRYAIKFGDQLSKENCQNLMIALANCKTPFQCAHGRPVMAVITELPNGVRNYTINTNSIKKLKN